MWTFEAYSDDGRYRWRLMASDGRRVATSGEFLSSESNAKHSAEHFKAIAPSWMYEVYPDDGAGFRWRAKAANGRVVAISHDTFRTSSEAQRAVNDVKANALRASGA